MRASRKVKSVNQNNVGLRKCARNMKSQYKDWLYKVSLFYIIYLSSVKQSYFLSQSYPFECTNPVYYRPLRTFKPTSFWLAKLTEKLPVHK